MKADKRTALAWMSSHNDMGPLRRVNVEQIDIMNSNVISVIKSSSE